VNIPNIPSGILIDQDMRGVDMASLEAELASNGWPINDDALRRFVVLAGVPGTPPIFSASVALPSDAVGLVAAAHSQLAEHFGSGVLAPWVLHVAKPLAARVILKLHEQPGH
jgi:hypothetical protein